MEYYPDYCTNPFQQIEIHSNGDIFTCCPTWNNKYAIGNINEQSFEEIWNSPKAIKLRENILKHDYSICNKETCWMLMGNFVSEFNQEPKLIMDKYPLIVKYGYDKECNIACKTCRDSVLFGRLTDEELNYCNSKLDSFLTILKDAKVLVINSGGDPFASRFCRTLIQKAAKIYPDLKFDFHTNGILCNAENFKKLNITPDKIYKIEISTHAASEQMYNKIAPGFGHLFNKIMKNLQYIKELRKKYEIEFYIYFVITSINYKEIPAFLGLAESVGAIPRLWEYNKYCASYDLQEYLSIEREDHPLHKDLLKVLEHPLVIKHNKNFAFSYAFSKLIRTN